MARIRKFSAYQKLERPYTRISKFTKKSFVRGGFPALKITKFDLGTQQKTFNTTIKLNVQRSMNIRQNALESARTTSNRLLEKTIGIKAYHLRLKVYPFHVLRENPLASGAGADRMSTGMTKAYGKSIGTAARMREGQTVLELRIDQANAKLGRQALGMASKKLPCTCKVVVGQ
ncbi:TPA: 50S ribosomal protein L16 [Candidatus Woesearchaeota archaeon]|nr:50S ribosomal protein L16 [Candidatus Woesearchaeota archaeon]HIH13450.1 50S ribosomal protein L16 [Candidatus Woesearchaeota archaeon]